MSEEIRRARASIPPLRLASILSTTIICCAIKCRIAISEHSISHAPIRSAPRNAWRAESKSWVMKSKFAKQLDGVSFLVGIGE